MTQRKFFFACLAAQGKLARKHILTLLCMAVVALVFSAATAFAAQNMLAQKDYAGITVAVASEEDNEALDIIVSLVAQVPDVAGSAEICYTTPQQAFAMVQNGSATAALVLPQGFLASVYAGEVLPPRLVVDPSRPLEAALLLQMAQSAVRMISSVEQGINFAVEVYDASGAQQPTLSAATLDVAVSYFSWVMAASNLYRAHEVSATGTLSVLQHYLLSALFYFTALALPVLYPLYAFGRQRGWLARLRGAGLPVPLYALSQLCVGAAPIAAMLCVLCAGAGLAGQGGFALALVPGVLLCAAFLSCWGFLCCNAGGVLPATGLNFLLFTVALLLSGGLIPLALLPPAFARAAAFSPITWMRGTLSPLYGAPLTAGSLLPLSVATALLLGGCLLVAMQAERRRA